MSRSTSRAANVGQALCSFTSRQTRGWAGARGHRAATTRPGPSRAGCGVGRGGRRCRPGAGGARGLETPRQRPSRNPGRSQRAAKAMPQSSTRLSSAPSTEHPSHTCWVAGQGGWSLRAVPRRRRTVSRPKRLASRLHPWSGRGFAAGAPWLSVQDRVVATPTAPPESWGGWGAAP